MDRQTLKAMLFNHEFNPMENIVYLIKPKQDFIAEYGVEAMHELIREVSLEAAEIKMSGFTLPREGTRNVKAKASCNGKRRKPRSGRFVARHRCSVGCR